MYADDMSYFVHHSQTAASIIWLKKISAEFGLILNEKKSGILPVKDFYKKCKLGDINEIEGIAIVNNYKYLGIEIDRQGTLNPYVERIRKRFVYLKHILINLLKSMTMENRFMLW